MNGDYIWITKNGNHIRIKNNQSPMDAFIRQSISEKKREDVLRINNINKLNYEIPQEQLDKFKNKSNGNYYLTEIEPDDYLKITSNSKIIEAIKMETKKYGALDLKKINNGYIMLEVDLENGKVINHEGRHRIQLLKNNGYKKVQIIIMSKNNYYDENFAHNIGSLHLKHQMENESFTTTLTNLKILNKK